MRTTALALAGALLAVGPAPAAAQAEFGFLGGVAQASTSGSAGHGQFGLGGIMAAVPLGTALALRPEALVSAVGAEESRSAEQERMSMRLHFAEFPLLVEYRFDGGADAIRPMLYAGPSAEFRIGCQAALPAAAGPCDPRFSSFGPEAFRRTNFSFIVGGEVSFRGATLGLRYDRGLLGLAAPDGGGAAASADTRPELLAVTVGWRFRTGS